MSLSINFGDFVLPANTEIYIYNQMGNIITGPITEKENNEKKVWGSSIYKGEMIHIELKVPTIYLEDIRLNITNIAYGYYATYGFGQSSCNINVLCPLGNGWGNEINSVALILNEKGDSWCSGALINNTCNVNIPYVLTANHCYTGGGGQDVSKWRFIFQHWSSTCDPSSDDATDLVFNGSTLQAASNTNDFALVKMNQVPDANSGLHYAGWSKASGSGGPGVQQITIIHHPAGDVMKISRDINFPSYFTFNGAQCWLVDLDQETTDGGSSGSPFFDQNHRIIGQATGNYGGGCQSKSAFGGIFSGSWTGGGTTATRLSDWLDPNNTGSFATNTTNVAALFSANPTLTISGSPTTDYLCSGTSTYTLNGLPANASVNWVVDNTGYATIPSPSTGSSVVVTKQGNGVITLTANVILCGGEVRTITKTIMVGASVAGYFRIASDYHNYGIFNTLYNNNSPIWLPPNKICGVDVWLTSPGIQSATWTRASNSYPFSWNSSGTFLSFTGTSGATAYAQRDGIFNLSAQTSCGTYNSTYTWPIIVQGWGSFMVLVSPNPAKDNLFVTIDEESPDVKALGREENISMALYDFNTNILVKKYDFKNNQNKFSLNISGLKKGQYIIVVNKAKYQQSKQIIIE